MRILREYVLVSQGAPRLELFTRGEGAGWAYNIASSPEATVRFVSIDCAVQLAAIYRDVVFGGRDG